MPSISRGFIPAAHMLARPGHATHRMLPLCFVVSGVLILHAGEAGPVASPASGGWKGFQPGIYRVDRRTCRGLSFRKHGDLYLKDDRPVRDALLKKLDDPSLMVRAMAAGSLGQLRERRAGPKLLAFAQAPAPATNGWFDPKLTAAVALGKIGDPAAIPVLEKLPDEPGSGQMVCGALAGTGEPAAKPLWGHYLQNTNWTTGSYELNALGQVGTRQTLATLQEYLTHCAPPEKRAIRETIQRIEERLAR